jgi:hypothetical protein
MLCGKRAGLPGIRRTNRSPVICSQTRAFWVKAGRHLPDHSEPDYFRLLSNFFSSSYIFDGAGFQKTRKILASPDNYWGSIKGDVKKKYFSSFLEEFFSYIQPLCGGKTSYSSACRLRWHFGLRCSVRAFAPASSGWAVANHGSI